VVSNGRVNLGGKGAHGAVGMLVNRVDRLLSLQPHIVCGDITGHDGEVDFGDGRDVFEKILSQLDGSVTAIVTPRGGSPLWSGGRIRVLAAASRSTAISFRSRGIEFIDMPAAQSNMKQQLHHVSLSPSCIAKMGG